ncbi:MAG: hypothetical protein GF410_06490 [Chitinivibrionales bacterium]|nr:hypothetical protein [Chitinivibrionales bacterium]
MAPHRFFIVGVQRGGTTYLYKFLDAHPQICMATPLRPEPKFFLFDDLFAKGRTYYEKTYFQASSDTRAYGEKSTSYLETRHVPGRISRYYPQARILITLRDPMTRALSNYFFSRANGLETRSPEDVFLHSAPAPSLEGVHVSVDPFNYVGRGMYLESVKSFVEAFGREHVIVLVFERFVSRFIEYSPRVYDFLGVNPDFVPSMASDMRINKGIQEFSVSAKVQERLREIYRRPVAELQDYLDEDISFWNDCRWE